MFNSVTLEMSIKPFKQTDDAYIRQVCERVFSHWLPFIKDRKTVAVQLWTADGSEILDYSGNLDDEFEWCYFLGLASAPLFKEGDDATLSLHERKCLYIEKPPKMTYRILKKIVSTIKEVGKEYCPDAQIKVGEIFDIGPEFALSDFKYNRHKEICLGVSDGEECLIDSTAFLNGDDWHYAAYPNGIPDKTPFGTFLGKQSNAFLSDLGFDYIWLSNGVGFSCNPWELTGKVFDGKDFYPEKLAQTKKNVFEFWRLFREGCPDFPIVPRGTNNTVGVDYATDGVPLYDIYKAGFNISSPPNSPWAALTDDFGLEIFGHMTRVCELPSDDFSMRYYFHDPWWVNTPWYDRYNGCPHDIYLPLAISRIDENGKVQPTERFHMAIIDNSFGDMPDCCVYEVLPHIMKAEKISPDKIAPLVSVYPLREYTTTEDTTYLNEMYYGDTFIRDGINCGFPINTIVSSDNFLKHSIDLYKGSVLVSPYQPSKEVRERLCEFAENGGKVLYYTTKERIDCLENRDGVEIVDIASNPEELRKALARLGVEIEIICNNENDKTPTITLHRNNNAYIFAAYNPNTTNEIRMKFPLGAPILDCGETEIVNGYSTYNFPRCEQKECRVFVKQDSGVISLQEAPPVSGEFRRRILIRGLKNATVCVFPEYTRARDCKFVNATDDRWFFDMCLKYEEGWELIEDENGIYYKAENITGDYSIGMPFPTPKR